MKRLFIVPHIHKTAGSTLLANLLENFGEDERLPVYAGPAGLEIDATSEDQGWDAAKLDAYVAANARPEVRLVYGHMIHWGIHEYFDPSRRPYYATIVRDPVERVISLYQYNRQLGGSWHREIVSHGWSLEEWLEKSRMLWRSNGQVRQLLWRARPEVLRDDVLRQSHLDEARELLERFDFVGTTETFDEDSSYLYGKLGIHRFHANPVVRATPDKEKVPETVRRLVAERNQLDIELYEAAKSFRARTISAHRTSFLFQTTKAGLRRRAQRRPDLEESAQPEAKPLMKNPTLDGHEIVRIARYDSRKAGEYHAGVARDAAGDEIFFVVYAPYEDGETVPDENSPTGFEHRVLSLVPLELVSELATP